MPDRADLTVAFLLALLTFFIFLPATRFDFVNLDDYPIIKLNGHVTRGLTAEGVRWAFTNLDQGAYFPLTWLSFQLDAQLYGMHASGYHLTNILLHTGNAALLFWFLRLATGSRWRSAGVAAIFALHPLRVESVVWVTERKDVLCGFFGFLALIAYVRYARRPSVRAYLFVFGLYTLSLLCKSMLVTLPCLLLLLDLWPLERLNVAWGTVRQREVGNPLRGGATLSASIARLVLEKVPMVAPALVVAVLTTLGQSRMGGVEGFEAIGVMERIANAFVSYVRYAWKMVWIRDFAVFYPFDPVPARLAVPAALAVAAVTLLVLWRARRWPWLATGWLWYLGTLLPMIGLIAVGGLAWANRFSYFPTIGLLIMAFWSLPCPRPSLRWRLAYAGAAAIVLGVLCGATLREMSYWKNSMTLLEHDLELIPGENFIRTVLAQAHANVANDLHERRDLVGAIEEWRRALALNPHRTDLSLQLAEELTTLGRLPEAIACCRQALRLEPSSLEMHLRLGSLLLKAGQLGESAAHFRRALAIDPRLVKAHAGLGAALCMAGLPDEGALEFSAALRLDPLSAEAHDGFGMVLLARGQVSDAARHFAQAVRITPDSARCHNNLGVAMAQLGDLDTALHEFESAVRLDPTYNGARENLDHTRAERDRSRKDSR